MTWSSVPATRGATRARDDAPAFALATVPDAVTDAEVVVNATNGAASMAMLSLAGAERLAGKVLLDIANPLDFSNGFPPTLLVKDTDSLGEQIQRAFPDTRVGKSLNTLTADLMVRPAARGHQRLLVGRRLIGEGDRHGTAPGVRPLRRDRPRRHHHRPRHRDDPAGLAAADGGAGDGELQLQDRALISSRPEQSVNPRELPGRAVAASDCAVEH